MNADQVCTQFLQSFHTSFDSNRQQCLQNFFLEASTVQFEGDNAKGLQAIGAKFSSLNVPQNVQRVVSTKDIQPSSLVMNALEIFVINKRAC